MNETNSNGKLVARLDHIAHILLLVSIFVLPLVALPAGWLPIQIVKMGILALMVSGSLILWAVARLNEHTIVLPRTHVLSASLGLIIGYVVVALLSSHVIQSLIGFGFERDTVLAMTTFIGALCAVLVTTKTLAHIAHMQIVGLAAFLVFACIQTLRVVFGAETILPNVFSSNVTTTVLGSWNDIGVMSGLVLVLVVTSLSLFKPKLYLKIALAVASLFSLFLLSVVNLSSVWAVLALMSLLIFVYVVSDASYDRTSGNFKPRFPLLRMVPSVGVLAVSVVFLIGGTGLGNTIADTFNVAYVDVRPSWEGTVAVGAGVYKESALAGVGPNSFRTAWIEHKPAAVNQTTFWNTDFNFGVGYIPSAFITGGVLVGLLWILFFVSFVRLGFKLFATRIAKESLMYVAVSTYMGAAFLWILSILYVPQTVMLAYTFMLTGAAIAAAHMAGVLRTREVKASDGYAQGLGLMAGVLVVAVLSFGTLLVHAERAYAGAMLSRAVIAANSGDLTRADYIAGRTTIIGSDTRALQLQVNTGLVRISQIVNDQEGDVEVLRTRFQDELVRTISNAQKIVDRDSGNYRNHMLLGEIYAQLVPLGVDGAYENAVDAYTKALELNGRNPSIHINLARLALAGDDTPEAIRYLQEALALKGNYTDAYYLLSQIAIQEGDAAEAIRSTEAAVLLRPSNPGLLFQLGILHYSLGNYAQVIPVLERAIAINSQYANALYFLGLAYDQTGNADGALAAFERVATLNPENVEVQGIVTALTEGKSALSALKKDAADVVTSPNLPVSEGL